MPSISTVADSTTTKFTKVLPLSIRKDGMASSLSSSLCSDGGQGNAQDLKEYVRVTLIYPSPSCGAMNPNKEITLRITNDDNPLFFYHLRISEGEYPELKNHQGLLVDFHGFPNQLVTLLDRCDPNSGEDTGPKFLLVMKIGQGNNNTVLDIVESNPFKYLCHLSLFINAGSDGEVKKYLCDVTTGLKKDYQLLKDKYNHLMTALENETVRAKEQMEAKNEEIAQLREQLHIQVNSMSTKHFEDMTQEKEKLLKLQGELASKFDQERNDIERRHAISISNFEERIISLESENRDLLQNKYRNETSLQEAGIRIKNIEDDLKITQQEMSVLKKQNEKLDSDYHEKQRLCSSLNGRVNLLETDCREKQAILQKNHEQIAQLSELKNNLEDHVTAMVREVERITEVNKRVSSELIKANEIIKKLQDDIRNCNSKTKLQTQVVSEQERVITDRDRTISSLESKISSLTAALDETSAELQKITTSEQDCRTKIEELETTIKTNENMISWLNKQLNEFEGLSNLSKFRQNLAYSANQLQAPSPIPGVTDIAPPQPNHLSRKFGAAPPPPYNANANQSHQNQNSLPNGTPSWMHIYQSTSTPLDDDLSSRLEKVSTNPGLGINYNELKSRFADPLSSHPQVGTVTSTTPPDPKEKDSKTKKNRPPTWAKGRGAGGNRVTLELGSTKPPGPGILRR